MKMVRISTLVLSGVMLATGLFAQTQTHSHDHPAQPSTPGGKQVPAKPGTMDEKMMAHCMEMMQKHDQMQAEIKAQDARIDDLVTKMNTSTGGERVEAMAAVITELSAQRKVRQGKMAAMQADMMQHMMEHMQMGKQSMSMCPMMKGIQLPPGATPTPEDHSKHHPSGKE